jgi:hypothetical protein
MYVLFAPAFAAFSEHFTSFKLCEQVVKSFPWVFPPWFGSEKHGVDKPVQE